MAESLAIVAPDMRDGGSVGAVAWRHAIELSRRCTTHVITRAMPPEVPPELHASVVHPSTWNGLRRYCHVPNELSFLRACRHALDALCERERIDVVWCHSHALAAMAAAPLRGKRRVRVVMTTHGDIFDRPPGTYTPELTWFYRRVTPKAYRAADYVHVLSPAMAERAVAGGARRERVRLIPNGVDPGEIGAAESSPRAPESFLPDGALRLLYVGSLWSVKGADVLIGALDRLRSTAASACLAWVPERVQLTLIGTGNERAVLERLVAKLGVAAQVAFHGTVARTELAAHYAQADVLCIPSRSESFSLVAVEAMICGVPVVGSDTGGIAFLVDEGGNGHKAQPGDAASLAGAIARAAASREHLAALGAEGVRKAREQFRWDRVGAALAELAHEAAAA